MNYYHVRITRRSDRGSDCVELDLSERNLLQSIVEPYKDGKKFLCGGILVDPFDIEAIQINKTSQPSSAYLPAIRARNAASSVLVIGIPDEWYVTEEGEVVTREFISTAPGAAPISPELSTNKMTGDDHRFMQMAIQESRQSEDENDGRVHPKVGAVVVKDGEVLATAHRGEIALGAHAEYIALERKLPSTDLRGATIYTTLEPCTSRREKTPCAERIVQRKIRKVVIGILDPYPSIHGGSVYMLKQAGIEVGFAEASLEREIRSLNKAFLEEQRTAAQLGFDDKQQLDSEKATARSLAERESLEDRSGSAIAAYLMTVIGGGLFLFLNFLISSPVSVFFFAVIGTGLVGAPIVYLKNLTRLTNTDMVALICRRRPLVLFAFVLFTVGIITLDLSLFLYPLYGKVIFSTQLSALSVFSLLVTSLVALVEGIIGVPSMPRFDSVHIRLGVGGYVRRFKSYGKAGVAIGLIVLAVSSLVVPMDIALVLWTPKVGLVEYRYVIGDTIYIVPLGQPRFEAYTINEELVHILRPAYPLVSSFTYSLVGNSTRDSTILKEVGASCQLVTESGLLTGLKISFTEPPASDLVCDVRYYNSLGVTSVMSFEESNPDLPITHFENGTTQWQHTITIRNLSQQYSLEFMGADQLLSVRGWYNVTIVNNDTNVMWSSSPTESWVYLYLAPSSLEPDGFAKIVITYNEP